MKLIAVLVAFLCCGAAARGQEVVPIVAGVVTMAVKTGASTHGVAASTGKAKLYVQ